MSKEHTYECQIYKPDSSDGANMRAILDPVWDLLSKKEFIASQEEKDDVRARKARKKDAKKMDRLLSGPLRRRLVSR